MNSGSLKNITTTSKCLLDFKPFHAFQDVPGGLCGPVLHDFPVQTDQHVFAFDFQGEELFAPPSRLKHQYNHTLIFSFILI